MGEKLKISVVIATYGRSEILPETLQCLELQTLDPSCFEVLVIDDGSPDNTSEVVQGLQKKMSYSLIYLRHPNRGICYTQNRGIQAARAPIVLLIPDDVFLTPQALEAHLESHALHPEPVVAVLGRNLQSPELAKHSVFLKHWDPWKFKKRVVPVELPYYKFWACNISCKKAFLLRSGLFNEQMVEEGSYAHEDVELGCRLEKEGLRLLYNPEALGYHYHLMTLENVIRLYYLRGLRWIKLRQTSARPEISVVYHVLSPRTLKDYIYTFRNSNNLVGADRNLFLLLARQMMHAVMFNSVSVPLVWLPMVKAAETNSLLSRFVHAQLYRGVLSHHFYRGVSDSRRGVSRFS